MTKYKLMLWFVDGVMVEQSRLEVIIQTRVMEQRASVQRASAFDLTSGISVHYRRRPHHHHHYSKPRLEVCEHHFSLPAVINH